MTFIVYHAGCPDGAMAAAIFLRERGGEVRVLAPASYQKPLVEVFDIREEVDWVGLSGATVYVLDFSFSLEDMEHLVRRVGDGGRVIVLDHHKSAAERYANYVTPSNVRLLFDLEHSGAMLAWQHFYPNTPPPAIVAHVEDYDLWRHALPESRAVHAFLRMLDMDVAKYAALLNEGDAVHLARFVGSYILRANEQQAERLAEKPQVVAFRGLTALAACAPLHQDDVGSILAVKCESGVGICWYYRDGRYKVSLRSRSVGGREPFDCSALAKMYGGGGHRGAAAFSCDELPW